MFAGSPKKRINEVSHRIGEQNIPEKPNGVDSPSGINATGEPNNCPNTVDFPHPEQIEQRGTKRTLGDKEVVQRLGLATTREPRQSQGEEQGENQDYHGHSYRPSHCPRSNSQAPKRHKAVNGNHRNIQKYRNGNPKITGCTRSYHGNIATTAMKGTMSPIMTAPMRFTSSPFPRV